jgi:hypothetical protein
METLALCCKTLYDNDIINKQNELDTYKQNNLQPVIHFNSMEEFEEKKQLMFQELKKNIQKWYIEENNNNEGLFEWSCCSCYPNPFNDRLYDTIYDALRILKFKRTKWLNNFVYSLCVGFDYTLKAVIDIRYIDNHDYDDDEYDDYGGFSGMNIINHFPSIIYKSIENQLEELMFGESCRIETVFRFTCSRCLKHTKWERTTISEYSNEYKDVCFDCEDILEAVSKTASSHNDTIQARRSAIKYLRNKS